jgi:hypothetical protein
MKSLNLSLMIVLFTFLAGCNGCKKTGNATNPVEITFDSIQETATYHLFNDTTKPYCNLRIHFTYPAACPDTNLLQSLQTIFIAKYFGNDYLGKTPAEVIEIYKKQYIENYRQFEQDKKFDRSVYSLAEGHADAGDSPFSYYEVSENRILFNQNGILSFTVYSENFTGGAHGAHKLTACVVDLNTGALLTESDIFCENYTDAIAGAIVQKILQKNNLSKPEELENIGYMDVKGITPNGNFSADDKGITYIFNEYEIAPYVMGRTEVFLPYSEINLYINKQGPLARLVF